MAGSTNLVIILGMMQVSKKVPFDDPTVLNSVRALYVVSNLIIVGIYYYVGMKIKVKRGHNSYPSCGFTLLTSTRYDDLEIR